MSKANNDSVCFLCGSGIGEGKRDGVFISIAQANEKTKSAILHEKNIYCEQNKFLICGSCFKRTKLPFPCRLDYVNKDENKNLDCNVNPKTCMSAVKKNPYMLQYVQNQTEEVCLASVAQNGFALEYVDDQTPELCMTAVKQNGWALEHVEQQTEEICMEAVKVAGSTLQFVKDKTLNICIAAVRTNRIPGMFFVPAELKTSTLNALNS